MPTSGSRRIQTEHSLMSPVARVSSLAHPKMARMKERSEASESKGL